MKTRLISKTLEKEIVDPLWNHLKQGLEDAKAGRIRLWKPRHIRNQ